MSISPMNQFLVRSGSRSGRRILTSLLLAAFILGIFAGDAQNALAWDLTKLKNASFEKDTNADGIPNNWFRSGAVLGKRVCNQSYAGDCSYRMGGDGNSYLYQVTLNSSGPAGIVATLSMWTKGKDVDLGAGVARGYVLFDHTDVSTNSCFLYIPAGTSAWTLRETSCAATEAFDNIQIWLQTFLDSGKIWVDKVKIVTEAP